MQNTLYIIDGNSLLHRAWHAIPPLTTKDGTVVNAAYGFAMALDRLLSQERPTHIAVCWDVRGGTFRDEVYEAYKATREEKEQELYDQIPIIEEILAAHGIPSFGLEGFEADDLIGTIAERVCHNKSYRTVIVTGDLDALQLVDDSTIVRFFVKGLTQTMEYDVAAVRERYGFGPEHIVDYKALKGDPSDNIPGVRGIGEKTAHDVIVAHGDLDAIYRALDAGKLEATAAVQTKLREGREDAAMSRTLATIVRDVPLAFSLRDATVREPDWQAVLRVYKRLEFASLVRRVETRVAEGADEGTPKSRKRSSKQSTEPTGVIIVDRDGAYVEDALEYFKGAKRMAFDVRTHAADLFGSSVTALTLADASRAFVFVSPAPATVVALKPLLETTALVTHDLKRGLHAMHSASVALCTDGLDLMVGAYLVRVGNRQHDMESVLDDLVGVSVKMPTSFETEAAFASLGRAAMFMAISAEALETRLKEEGMLKLYRVLEHPLIPVLARMERAGIAIDTKELDGLSHAMDKGLVRLTKAIYRDAGREFNINSPSQLASVLFEDLGLETKGIHKTQSGYSTAAPMLEKLTDAHPIVKKIGEYREYAKLKSTYVDALPALADATRRVHTTYNQTVTATGRLSSQGPNLQNIPVRTERGREVRKAFVAAHGKRLVSADYSQIELRLVAALSGDERMKGVFINGGDIHTATAARVFGVNESEVTKSQRRAAKAVNFGIIYGMGPRALSRAIDVPFADAKAFIDKYFETFPGARSYLDAVLEAAMTRGYAQSHFGRRRYLPDLRSGVQQVRAAAERMAKNMPLQGTASDVMKMAMIAVDGWIRDEGFGEEVRMLLQVHDELVLEVESARVEAVANTVRSLMENVAQFSVPLVVDVEVGSNWNEMKKI